MAKQVKRNNTEGALSDKTFFKDQHPDLKVDYLMANLKKNRGIQFASPKEYKFKSSSKGKSESIVEKVYPKYENENVYVNEADYFESVPEEVWNFHVGGYQVLHKWLKDRRERALSDEDVLHYRKVVVSLGETIVIMREVDEVIGRFGGFPDAFGGMKFEVGSLKGRSEKGKKHEPRTKQ